MYSRNEGIEIGEFFVKEFVLGVGWVSGIFWRVGIDPEAAIFGALRQIYESLVPEPRVSWIFWVLPIIITIFSWTGAYYLGGTLGIIAILMAFIGGFFYDNTIGWILVIGGLLLGAFSARRQESEIFRY
jgi:hypothetical protein